MTARATGARVAPRAPAWAFAALAVSYFLAAKLGIALSTVGIVSPIWPPTGIAYAALIVGGLRLWPAIFVGELLAEATSGGNPSVWLAIATGNVLQDVLGAWLVTRWADGPRAFEHSASYLRFTGIAFASTIVGASVGAPAFVLGGSIPAESLVNAWLTYWIGDAVGVLVVAPVLVLALTSAHRARRPQLAHVLVVPAVALALSALVFVLPLPPRLEGAPVAFLLVPLIAWVALRGGPLVAAATALGMSAIAIAGTLASRGPFGHEPPVDSLVILQTFMASVSITGIGLAVAVDERVRAQAAAEALARSNRDLEQLAFVAAHDLRQPLQLVSGYLALLDRRATQLDEKARSILGEARHGTERMDALVTGLLTYARLSSEPRAAGPTSSREALDAALANLAQAVSDSRASVKVEGEFPPVRADPTQLSRVFQNLVANALKFHGEKPPAVTIRGHVDADEVRFEVADQGIGLAPEEKERVFGMFERGSRATEGAGIGLAVCQRIVEQNGGRIWVESESGHGARFLFTWPR